MSLLKKHQSSEVEPSETPKAASDPRRKKGPTPSRKEQEARNYQGLLGVDKKVAKQRAREESRRRFEREQEGLRTGREDLLPYQHRGPARRLVRDYVDSRYSFAEYMILLVLIVMTVSLIGVSIAAGSNPGLAEQINRFTLISSYSILIVGMVEAGMVAGKARRLAINKFGIDRIPRGLRWYAFSRAIMIRRWRSPKAQVARGSFSKKNQGNN